MTETAFEVGHTYQMREIGYDNLVSTFSVVERTQNTVSLLFPMGRIFKRTVRKRDCTEFVFPYGTYDCAPALFANTGKRGEVSFGPCILGDRSDGDLFFQPKSASTDIGRGT